MVGGFKKYYSVEHTVEHVFFGGGSCTFISILQMFDDVPST